MIEFLEEIDRAIVLAVNGCNSPFLDNLMWYATKIPTWIPLYIFLLVLVYKKYNLKQFFLFLGTLGLTILLCDQISSSFFKPVVARWRPSHNLLLAGKLHLHELKPGEFYKGGMYSFISGHATNSYAIAVLFTLVLKAHYKKIGFYLILWASLVAYTRLYLGVHYLSDILAGCAVGTLVAWSANKFLFVSFSNKMKL